MIDFSNLFQLKGLKPKNKVHTNFYGRLLLSLGIWSIRRNDHLLFSCFHEASEKLRNYHQNKKHTFFVSDYSPSLKELAEHGGRRWVGVFTPQTLFEKRHFQTLLIKAVQHGLCYGMENHFNKSSIMAKI